MNSFDRVLSRAEDTLAALSLAAAFVISAVSVILRYVFETSLYWAQEATIYLIIFSTFVGAVVTLRHNEHVNVDIIPTLLGERGKRAFGLISAALLVIYCAVIGGFAWILIFGPTASSITTAAMGLPLWVVEIGFVLGMTLMFVRSLEILYRTARGRTTFPESERDELLEEAESVQSETDGESGEERDGREGREER